MAHEDSYIFHENNYLQSSFSAFQDMRMKSELTDVVIKVRDREFRAHHVVLAARIPHFRKILPTQHKEILLSEIDPNVMEALINFAYEGKLKITAANAQKVIFAAVRLRLQQIQEICLSILAKRFNSTSDTATLSFIKGLPSDEYIHQNFEKFSSTEEFLFLPYCAVKEIFCSDNLKVRNEGKVFEALIKWTKVSLAERQHFLPYLLSEIRMNYLSSEYLIEKVAAEGLIKMSDQCKHMVEEAKNCHLLKKRLMYHSFRTNPRLYTEMYSNVCYLTTTVTSEQSVSHSDNITHVTANINVGQGDATTAMATDQKVALGGDAMVLTANQNVNQGVSATVVTTNQNVVQGGDAMFRTAYQNVNQGASATVVTTNQNVQGGDAIVLTANQNVAQGGDAMVLTANQIVTQGAPVTVMTTNENAQGVAAKVVTANQNGTRVDSATIMTTNESVAQQDTIAAATTKRSSLHSDVSNAVVNVSGPCGSSKNGNVSNGIKHGVYALRSFDSIGTFVSYYNDRNKKWDNFPKKSQRHYLLHVAAVKDKLYVFFPDVIETFNLVTHEWSVVGSVGSLIRSAGIVSYGCTIYVFGGINFLNTIRSFNTQQNKWLPYGDMKYPCSNMSVCSAPKKCVFLTGGYGTYCYNKFLKFHPSTKEWTELKPMICPRMDHDSAVLNDKVYVCGGRNSNARFLSTMEVYDSLLNQWTSIDSDPKVYRRFPSLVSWGNRLYLVGGKTDKDACFCGVKVYDPSANKWLPGAPVPLYETRVTQGSVSFPTEEKLPCFIVGVVAEPEE